MLNRRQFLASSAALPLMGAARKPNFIVIYTDDQGIGDLGCYGGRDMKTPHLDSLAASGARFTNWYTNSPVCSPSRCAVMTGQYPVRHGIRNFLPARATLDVEGLKPGAVTMAGELRKLGYRTAQVGKWHLGSAPGSRPLDQGFDEQIGFLSGWHDYYSHRYYQLSKTGPEHIFPDLWRNGKPAQEEPSYATELFSREAASFIGRQKKDQPFFLYLAYGAPHYPMMAPRKYLERFPASMDPERRLFAAMVAAIDDGVGEIRAALKKRGLDRDTAIFFQSDNGATIEARADGQGRPYHGGSNAPFRGYKGGLFEGGIRMPALMAWPGTIPAGTVVEETGAAFDVMPTFLQWAGGAAAGADGADVAAMVTSKGRSPHGALFWEYQGQFAVRRGDWKLMQQPKEGLGLPEVAPVWLSNLKDDPGERENWAGREPGVVKELAEKLEEWKRSTGATA